MIGWLAARLTTPVLYGLIGVLVVICALAGAKAALLAHDKGELQTQLGRAHADNAHLNTVITQVRAERDDLAGRIAEQNSAIDGLVTEGALARTRAIESAVEVERRHAKRERKIPTDVQADAVNAEIRARFEEAAR